MAYKVNGVGQEQESNEWVSGRSRTLVWGSRQEQQPAAVEWSGVAVLVGVWYSSQQQKQHEMGWDGVDGLQDRTVVCLAWGRDPGLFVFDATSHREVMGLWVWDGLSWVTECVHGEDYETVKTELDVRVTEVSDESESEDNSQELAGTGWVGSTNSKTSLGESSESSPVKQTKPKTKPALFHHVHTTKAANPPFGCALDE
ncbi:uncharacterized protein LY89DRAFT_762700 [Mollisia scopiformis]|uniref:Uncharacterized protein n=1 Tax=Mollisia scopiformis TaxID=149040 RepID=A0A194XQM8_MOLSC|nr:uncharacterized protein LY89DRAFT_762700 [Mollisia scopiformis]KUJ22471.1 hypothetical protein LY89DRAFT_762700 [Mollisia scopiformis]